MIRRMIRAIVQELIALPPMDLPEPVHGSRVKEPTFIPAWSRVRVWTVPHDDCIAMPTAGFYSNRWVRFSNEGTRLIPNWVALDRNNDPFEVWNKRGQMNHASNCIVIWANCKKSGEVPQASPRW